MPKRTVSKSGFDAFLSKRQLVVMCENTQFVIFEFFAHNEENQVRSFYDVNEKENFYVSGDVCQRKNGRLVRTKNLESVVKTPIKSWSIQMCDRTNLMHILIEDKRSNTFLVKSFRETYIPHIATDHKKFKLVSTTWEFLELENGGHSLRELFQYLTSSDIQLTEEYFYENIGFIFETILRVDPTYFDGRRGSVWNDTMSYVYHHSKTCSSVHTLSTTTNSIKEILGSFFKDQTKDLKKIADKSTKPCGSCVGCRKRDCGRCQNCRRRFKFAGSSTNKIRCDARKCLKVPKVQDAQETISTELRDNRDRFKTHSNKKTFDLLKRTVTSETGCTYYKAVRVESEIIKRGDFVLIRPEVYNKPPIIAKIFYFWKDTDNIAKFHGYVFERAENTILGETADSTELFVVDNCEAFLVKKIMSLAKVVYKPVPENWSDCGGEHTFCPPKDTSGKHFYFRHRYISARSAFVELDYEFFDSMRDLECPSCRRQIQNLHSETAKFGNKGISWKGQEYLIGTGVFLNYSEYSWLYYKAPETETNDSSGSEFEDCDKYPEHYRKRSDRKNLRKVKTEPFCVARIEEFYMSSGKVQMRVRHFARPEYMENSDSLSYNSDLNLLFWTSRTTVISTDDILGKCFVMFSKTLKIAPREWIKRGPLRFYFDQEYDFDDNKIIDLPDVAETYEPDLTILDYFPIEPLRCLDLFAGCGGFSLGLEQAKVIKPKWAIELDACAAHSYELNHKEATVYYGDANKILSRILSNQAPDLPSKGEVEMIVSGPPCQSFSGINRFSETVQFQLMNSLIVTCLGFVDYYRPKYFVLENVSDFASFKKGLVLKLVLRAISAMGYQVTFGNLQAGNYGVPQSRPRLIVIAAAPKCALPSFPEPLNCFDIQTSNLAITVDGTKFTTGLQWNESAPFRQLFVEDAILDLPYIPNDEIDNCNDRLPYRTEAASHFQRNMRKNHFSDALVTNHVPKKMGELQLLRIQHIKKGRNMDWRNLPNIEVQLPDGTLTTVLKYKYHKTNQRKSENPRALCSCALGNPCDSKNYQCKTLIPWGLSHTGDANNNWSGMFGRVSRKGSFPTTTSNPDPMNKQGRVLHHTEDRILSVREWARSQGFPDEYIIFGELQDKYKQIGNAIPPPLAAAIGEQLKKCIWENEISAILL